MIINMDDYLELSSFRGIIPTVSQREHVDRLISQPEKYKFVGKMIDGTLIFTNLEIEGGNIIVI
jgi:hypothetical protein